MGSVFQVSKLTQFCISCYCLSLLFGAASVCGAEPAAARNAYMLMLLALWAVAKCIHGKKKHTLGRRNTKVNTRQTDVRFLSSLSYRPIGRTIVLIVYMVRRRNQLENILHAHHLVPQSFIQSVWRFSSGPVCLSVCVHVCLSTKDTFLFLCSSRRSDLIREVKL